MNPVDNFTKLIKEKRLKAKMTLEDVAMITNSSKSYIWELENKHTNLSLKLAISLSILFNIDLNNL